MATIALEGMHFSAFHGLYPEERIHGNQFVVDVYLTVPDTLVGDADEITGTVDYAEVCAVVERVFADRVDLIETLVYKIGTQLLGLNADVLAVQVRVSKLTPMLPVQTARSFVERIFHRPS